MSILTSSIPVKGEYINKGSYKSVRHVGDAAAKSQFSEAHQAELFWDSAAAAPARRGFWGLAVFQRLNAWVLSGDAPLFDCAATPLPL